MSRYNRVFRIYAKRPSREGTAFFSNDACFLFTGQFSSFRAKRSSFSSPLGNSIWPGVVPEVATLK